VISVGLSSLLLALQSSGTSALIAVYDFVVELSTVAEMVPYVFCCLVEGALYLTLGRSLGYFAPRTYIPIAFVAFLFAMWTIYGSGPTAGMWGLLLLLSGLPIYVVLHHRRVQSDTGQGAGAVNP
jgi:APA family basic amino acid/polyamine antiporter